MLPRVVQQMALLAPESQIVIGMVDQVIVEVRHGADDLDDAEFDRIALPAPPFLAGLRPDEAEAIIAHRLGLEEFPAVKPAADRVVLDAAFLAAVAGSDPNALADRLPLWRFD